MRISFLGLLSLCWAYALMSLSTGCHSRRSTPPPPPADSSGSEVSDETLRTLIVSLNKRYESIDGRISEDHQRIETLEKELTALRQSIDTLRPAQRSPGAAKGELNQASAKESRRETASPRDPRAVYESAFNAYKEGNYPTAVSRFQEFIEAFPASDLADNAFYWIGESYYAKEEFERAISSFLQLVDRYPQGNKVPDALFKVGLSYTRLRKPEKGREFFTRVMDNYPFSDAAQKAKANLDQLE
jgi:tol-pal system protein YbgF